MTNPKNIFFFLPNLSGGGAERVLLSVCNELSLKHNVTLVLIKKEGNYLSEVASSVKTIPLVSDNESFVLMKCFFRLRRLILQKKTTHIISCLVRANIVALLVKISLFSKQRPKFILREANTPSKAIQKAPKKLKILYSISKFLYRFADFFVAPSAGVKNDFVDFYKIRPEKVFQIPNPLDYEKISKQSREPLSKEHQQLLKLKEMNFVAMGRLEKAKGFDSLIRSFAKVVKRGHDNAQLLILGEGPKRSMLLDLSDSLGVKNLVHFLGFSVNPFNVIRNSDMFILSSRWEGLPNALLQALALEKPVISTNCPSGPSEIITHKKNGLLIEVDNIDELSLAIEEQIKTNFKYRGGLLDKDLFTKTHILKLWEEIIV